MHKAIVAKIDKVEEIPGADKIQVAYVLGERVIVSKELPVGYKGVLFPEGLQLSHDFCYHNNLYRDSDLNKDNAKGFFDKNRRVRAQKFMKVKSDAYFTDIKSLAFTKASLVSLKEGDQFDSLNGKEVCRKYINPQTAKAQNNKKKAKTKASTPLFKEHVDTEQFKYYVDKIPVGALISFHAKLHGTSARYSHTLVKRPLSNFKESVNKLGSVFGLRPFKEVESWEHVAGTRRVVLYQDQRDKIGFNGPEEWRFEWLDQLKPYLEKGVSVYGEIVGYANSSPIMGRHSTEPLGDKKYTKKYGKEMVYKYGCPEGENRFFIYRVTYTTPEGKEVDLSVDQVKHWAETRGFEHTIEVATRMIYEGDSENLRAVVESLTERKDTLTEDWIDPSHISEGIVVRVDHVDEVPRFYKNKSWAFKCMEGIWKESNVDVEDSN